MLFSVGGTQLKVMPEFELDAGGGVAEVVEPDELLLAPVDPVSATVVGEVAALLEPALEVPDSSLPPQPASASAALPNTTNPTKRPTRSAFCMLPPKMSASAGQGAVIIRRLHERAAQLEACLSLTRRMRRPGNPAVIGCSPLDRKFCAPVFRRVCP